MIRGRFEQSPVYRESRHAIAAPFLRGLVWLPDYDVSAEVPFFVDTGADLTVLHRADAMRLLATAEQWKRLARGKPKQFLGVASDALYYPAEAVITFVHDNGDLELVETLVHIAEPTRSAADMESLLGRDVLSQFVTVFHGLEELTLERI
jgi:hypothetical protein